MSAIRFKKRLATCQGRIQALHERNLKRLQARTSKVVGCRHCGSKIATKFIQDTVCPVCNLTLLPDTQARRLAVLRDEEKDLIQAVGELSV